MVYFFGTIMLFLCDFSPEGWMACEGQALKEKEYPALYSLLGQIYPGGDRGNTFALPNLKGTEPIPSMKYYICIDDNPLYPPNP